MNTIPSIRLLLLPALGIAFSTVHTSAQSQDRVVLSSRAQAHYQRVAPEMRENRLKKNRVVKPAERLEVSIPLYRYEASPTIRHDEVSSPEIVFHFENGRVVTGHDWED